MPLKPMNVLFLCTGNSARSILAEALLNREAKGRYIAYSAGSQPKGEVHPLSLELLASLGHDIKELRSKSWDEFAGPNAPNLDFVFTVCGNAADETCPVWFGTPMQAHWGIDDPAAATGTEEQKRIAFKKAYVQMHERITAFLSLPVASLDPQRLKQMLVEIGEMPQ